METIIETIEEAITNEEWAVNFHKEQLALSTEKIRKLKKELNELINLPKTK